MRHDGKREIHEFQLKKAERDGGCSSEQFALVYVGTYCVGILVSARKGGFLAFSAFPNLVRTLAGEGDERKRKRPRQRQRQRERETGTRETNRVRKTVKMGH